MKVLYVIIFLIIGALPGYTQNNVFVLVDVSKSVTQSDLNDARQGLGEVLTGSPLSKGFIDKGNQSDLSGFKLSPGDKLGISKFGSLRTTLASNPNLTQINDVNADVSQVLNSIVWEPTDGQTYLTLAKAKIAEFAKTHNITNYKLYVISDNINDDYGPGGRPSYPDDYTRNLAEGYNTSTNPVSEGGYTKLKFSPGSFFTLSLCPGVDISKYSLPATTGSNANAVIVDTTNTSTVITITSPPKSKKGNEYAVNTASVNINWNCTNSPKGIKYTVSVAQYEDGKYRDTKTELSSNSVNLKLPDGKFRITVAASNYSNASSDTTYVSINTGSYGMIIFLIILIMAAVIGYYVWNKYRGNEAGTDITDKEDAVFSKKSREVKSTNSQKSDYF